MELSLSFDDILIQPKFSNVFSRKDVDVSTTVSGEFLDLPIISSNMDSVTNSNMAKAMSKYGGVGCLHRFCSIEKNVSDYISSSTNSWVSIGLSKTELERAEALYSVGAHVFVVDVAHGASMYVVQQVQELKKLLHHSAKIIVGNFANRQSILDFNYHLGGEVDAYKVGIGSGAACTTRIVTGAGCPILASIIDCSVLGLDIIADGGIRNSGDFAKALAAGAKAVMLGGMLAGTDEAPGEVIWTQEGQYQYPPGFKKYRGSASLESYEVQGKLADHRVPEGESFLVPYVGPVKNVLQGLEAGLRSSMSYVGANTLSEFAEKSEFIQVTQNGYKESQAHGRT